MPSLRTDALRPFERTAVVSGDFSAEYSLDVVKVAVGFYGLLVCSGGCFSAAIQTDPFSRVTVL